MEMPHYVPEYFYLGDGVNKVDLMDVYRLADLAITLVPTCDDTVEDCVGEAKIKECIKALNIYISSDVGRGNYHNEDMKKLVDCYELLNSYLIGRELLFRTIHFKLWNKFLLNKGLSLNVIKDFSKADEDLKMIELVGTTINKEATMRSYNNSDAKTK